MSEGNIKTNPTRHMRMLGHLGNPYVATGTSPLSLPFPFPSLPSVYQQRDIPVDGDGHGKNTFQPLKDSSFPPLDFDMEKLVSVMFGSGSNLLEKGDGTTPTTLGDDDDDYEEEDDDDDVDLLLSSINLEPKAEITSWLSSLPSHSYENAPPPSSSSPSPPPKTKDACAQSSKKTVEPSTIQQSTQRVTEGTKPTSNDTTTATSKQTSPQELSVYQPAAGTSSEQNSGGPHTPSALVTSGLSAPIIPAAAAAQLSRIRKRTRPKNTRAKTILKDVTTQMLITLGYFDMKIGDVASKLGVGVTSLKKHCRVNLGITRWPSRERKSLAALQKYSGGYASKGLQGVSETALASQLAKYETLLAISPDAPMPLELKRMRQKIFRVGHNKRRMKEEDDDEKEVEWGGGGDE